ncbi:MAG: TlpA disulfide reductase family protein [Planctomycetota bacterium]
MNRYCQLSVVAILLSALFPGALFAGPGIGDKAPAVKIAEWVNHEPAALPGGKEAEKHIFIVEFWATWCRPCWNSIPHLAELHRKHEKQGLIIIGVSNEETETVSKFVNDKTKGKKRDMPYYVGVDDDMATTSDWTDDIPTIPHAFIVDKTGIVVWHGNPLDTEEMDSVLRQVLAGKYDIEAAKSASIVEKKYDKLMAELQATYAARNSERIFEILEQMIALKPDKLQPYLIKRKMLATFERQNEIPAWNEKTLEAFNDVPDSLSYLAQLELEEAPENRDPNLLVGATRRAVELADNPDAGTLALLARVQLEAGLIDRAIETQAKALKAAKDDDREPHQKSLDYFKAMKKLAKQLQL